MKIGRSLIVFILQVFTDDGILMLLDAQVEVTARVGCNKILHCDFNLRITQPR